MIVTTNLTLSQPKDRSLDAYKAWLRRVLSALGGEDDMTEEQWEAEWREFWADQPADEQTDQ